MRGSRSSPGRTTRTYLVDSIERFDRQALPVAVFARTGPERLRLVTCTGPYLPEAGGYQQNLVVTAVPVRGEPSRVAPSCQASHPRRWRPRQDSNLRPAD